MIAFIPAGRDMVLGQGSNYAPQNPHLSSIKPAAFNYNSAIQCLENTPSSWRSALCFFSDMYMWFTATVRESGLMLSTISTQSQTLECVNGS